MVWGFGVDLVVWVMVKLGIVVEAKVVVESRSCSGSVSGWQ